MDHGRRPAKIGRAATHTGTATVHVSDTAVLLTIDDGLPTALTPVQSTVLSGLLMRAAIALSHPEPLPDGVVGWPAGAAGRDPAEAEVVGLAQRIAARLVGRRDWPRIDRR